MQGFHCFDAPHSDVVSSAAVRQFSIGEGFRPSIGFYIRRCHHNVGPFDSEGDYLPPKQKVNFYEGVTAGRWKVNTTRILKVNPYDPFNITAATVEGWEQVQEVFRFMKRYVPGCENIRLEQSAPRLGIRESRRIVGEYTLTAEDAMSAKQFEDGICLCGYALDIHQPDGASGEFILIPGGAYAIPYRALLPKEVGNLLAAGASRPRTRRSPRFA